MWKKSCWASKCICAVLVISLCLLAGCAKQSQRDEQTVCFTDDLGRTVCVQQNPQRVAALIGSFADVWCLAGGTLCAAAEDAWEDFGLQLPDAVSLGGAHSPSLEAILAADPELVLASASTASNVELQDALERAGIPVAYFDVDCFADYLRMLGICTDLTGRNDLYEQNGLALQQQIERLKMELAAAQLPEKARTVLLLRASAGAVKAKGSKGTILGELLHELGCINIADNDQNLLETLSVESVIRQEPYRIFVVTMGDNTEKAMAGLSRMMEENPAWGTLTAVRENRLHIMDRHLFNMKPNARWAESYETLCAILLEKNQ